MWNYVQANDETGKALSGKDAIEAAKQHFCVRDPGCPVVELEPAGLVAVWCAAPLAEGARYPLLHHKPKGESSFDYVKGAAR